jgi:ribosomal-protein-alanine N-acetyltransferase
LKLITESERFILRELLPTDCDGMFELDSDPEVHRYLGNKPTTDKAQIIEVINNVRKQYSDHGIGRWAIIDKTTNEFIGWTGLKFVTEMTNNHQNYYDIGYRIRRKFWGQGIASETAAFCLDYAFNVLEVNEVYASASIENGGSNKILQKIGMNFIETFFYEDIECNWYKIERSENLKF